MPPVFKLQVSSPTKETAQVRVVESLAGESRHPLVLSFDETTVDALLQVLEKGDLQRCTLKDKELVALGNLGLIQDGHLLGAQARNRIVGQRLFEGLFPTSEDPNRNVRGALQAALTLAQQSEAAVPCQIRFDHDAVDLARLPWELICDPAGRHPVAEGMLRFTRYVTFGQAIAPFPVTDRLDVLVITSRPEGTPYLDPDAERRAIVEAFGELQKAHRVHVQHLDPPTRDALVRAVNAHPYDIVHFDGHGALARRCPVCEEFQPATVAHCINPDCRARGGRLQDGQLEGCLAFERSRDDPTSHLVGARDLATMLSGRHVRLFVASACQTGTVGGSNVFSSVGPSLIQAGVPAVLAMQFSVPAEPAARFAGEFYAALARGESIAAAASAGRRLLFDRGMWYVPAVYLRNRDGEGFLFRHRAWHYLQPAGAAAVDWASLRPPDAAPYKFLSPYEITDHVVFYGRSADTQRVMEEMSHRRHAVLFGPASVGKTSLVNAGLSPALIDRGYLVLTVREYGEPVAMLRQEVTASPVLEVDLTGASDLAGVVRALQRGVDRPTVIVFDEFDSFLRTSTADQQQRFARQLAAYAGADYPRRCCVLLVLRADAVGSLQPLQEAVPEIFHGAIGLKPLTRKQAQQAIEGPLRDRDPAIAYDGAFLEKLLHDLCAEAEENAINPAHLQIVCHQLYQAALEEGVRLIDDELYPEEGTKEILSHELKESLRRLGPGRRDLARGLLKQMVGAAGERVFVTPARAAGRTGAQLTDVQQVMDALLRDGLLETRVSTEGVLTYSLSHHLLTAEVYSWFDREEALNHCAQQALDRAWEDWYGQAHAPVREEAEREATLQPLLVAPDRLREIRERRSQVEIAAPQICLLLHSAVFHRCDMGYWASELGRHQQACDLLEQVQRGRVDDLPKREEKDARLCTQALGLGPDEAGVGTLAEGAVAHADGDVRHTAALALGALGMDAIHGAQRILADAVPSRRPWRRVQALAQMKAAGFPLPQLPLGSQGLVGAWATGLAVWDSYQQILTEALAAGMGSALGLGFCLLLSVLLILRDPRYLFRSLYLQPIGFVVGFLAVAMAWVGSRSVRARSSRTQAVGRIIGFWLGFVLGLVVFWLPLDLFVPRTSSMPAGRAALRTYLLGGSFWGLGMILGREALAGFRARGVPWRRLLGGGLGGAAGCVLAVGLGITVPLVEPSGRLLIQAAEAILAGFGLGAGLVAGWELGARLWGWLQGRQGG